MMPSATKWNGLFVTAMFVLAVGFLIFKPFDSLYGTIITMGAAVPLAFFIVLPRFRASKIFGEAVRTYVWALIFLYSLVHDRTFGLFPTLYGVMRGWSLWELLTGLREKKAPGQTASSP